MMSAYFTAIYTIKLSDQMQLHYPQIVRTIEHSSQHLGKKRENNSVCDIDEFKSIYKPKASSLNTTRTTSFNPYT